MKQLTLFDMDECLTNCRYCGSESICKTTHIYFGVTAQYISCESCKREWVEGVKKHVSDKQTAQRE